MKAMPPRCTRTLLLSFTLLLLTIPVSVARAAFSYDPALRWFTLHTPHFNVHYHNGEEILAQEVGATAERVHLRLQPFFNWVPEQPTNIVLTDTMDFSNGSATPVPDNRMMLLVTPPDDINSLEDYNQWMDMLIQHEYTHVLHLDKATGSPAGLRALFGRLFPWVFPNLLQPGWPIEGLATYMETDTRTGIGRGQSSAYQMFMRMEVADGVKPLRQINQPLVSWPAGTARYLYGVYFMQFIAEKYGAEKLRQWIDAYSNNLLPFALNSTSSDVFGKNLDQLWAEFSLVQTARFQPQLAQITQRGLREGGQLTHDGYSTSHPQVLPNGDVYYLRDDFASRSQLMRITAGDNAAYPIAEVRENRFDVHPDAGVLIAQLDVVRNSNIYSDLYRIENGSQKLQRLTQGKRYRYATWHPDGKSLLAVQNQAGNSSLHLLDATGTLLEVLWEGKEKEVIGEPHWSPDGSHMVAAVWRAGQWDLELFTLASRRWSTLTENTDIEAQPRFTANGAAVIFSADYDGVYNIRRLDLAKREITTLTNVRGGAFNPSLSHDEKTLYYSGVTPRGYDIFRLALSEVPPPPDAERATSVRKTPTLPSVVHKLFPISDYSPAESVNPKWWSPYFLFSDTRNELGFFTSGSDVLDRHSYALFLAHDFTNTWLFGDASYLYDRWNPTLKLHASRIPLEYLNSSKQVQLIQFSDTLTAEAVFPLISADAQWGLHSAMIYNQEQDASRFNSQPATRTLNDTLVGLGLTFNSSRQYPLSISPVDGRRIQFTLEQSSASSDYSGGVATLDWREYLRISKQQVLALRTVLGASNEQPRPYRLGGVFSEAAPHPLALPTQLLFNQRQFALRGYPTGLPGLRGDQVTAYSAEWRFPLHLVEYGITAPPLGIHQFFGNVFYNAGEAWFDGTPMESLRSGAGVELHTEVVLGYWLTLDLRLGAANGFNAGGENQVYFTLGASY